MDAHEERVILLQHRAKFRRDPLRKENGNARSNTQEFHVRDLAKFRQKKFELLVIKQKRVARAPHNVADVLILSDVFDLPIDLRMKIITSRIADQPRTRAVTAISGATVGYQK